MSLIISGIKLVMCGDMCIIIICPNKRLNTLSNVTRKAEWKGKNTSIN